MGGVEHSVGVLNRKPHQKQIMLNFQNINYSNPALIVLDILYLEIQVIPDLKGARTLKA